MKHLDKALIGAGAALLLSGGIAAAALGPSNVATAVMASLPGDVTLAVQNNGYIGGTNFLTTAATYIGITEAALRTELATGKSLADVAVAHGKTRDGLIAALVQASTTQITTLVDTKNPFPTRPAGGRGFPGGPRTEGNSLAAAATYLGITPADLLTKLQGGQTLAAVANATAGKSRDGLITALVADATAQIDQAQTAGKITAAQATQQKANLTVRVTAEVDSTRPAGPGFGGFPGGPRTEGNSLAAAATYLGITSTDLRTKLQAGQNLGQIAAATSGKSRDGLIAALVADENKQIDAAQTAGKITADQATQQKANVTTRVTALVDGTPGPGLGFGGPGRGRR